MSTVDTVRCLLIPLRETTLLVPSVVVAEVATHKPVANQPGLPRWCLGTLSWRNREIPVIDFEVVASPDQARTDAPSRPRLVVFHGVGDIAGLQYYGMIACGIPKAFRATAETRPEHGDPAQTFVRATVNTGRESAVIPDLDAIESQLAQLNQTPTLAAIEDEAT